MFGLPAEFQIQVSDAEGRALDDVEVRGESLRTSNSADDFDFRMLPRGEVAVPIEHTHTGRPAFHDAHHRIALNVIPDNRAAARR